MKTNTSNKSLADIRETTEEFDFEIDENDPTFEIAYLKSKDHIKIKKQY